MGKDYRAPAIAASVQPPTDWVLPTLLRDARGCIITGPDVMPDGNVPNGWSLLETSMSGIFARGDAPYRSVKRVDSAVRAGLSRSSWCMP